MANPEHLTKLNEGVEAWNKWRYENPRIAPDLNEANLSGNDFSRVLLSGSDLSRANLSGAYLSRANLSGVNLTGANLEETVLVSTNLEGANLSGCLVYGISAWDLNLQGAIQENIIITPQKEPTITVDNVAFQRKVDRFRG